jgi:hypothetical protein
MEWFKNIIGLQNEKTEQRKIELSNLEKLVNDGKLDKDSLEYQTRLKNIKNGEFKTEADKKMYGRWGKEGAFKDEDSDSDDNFPLRLNKIPRTDSDYGTGEDGKDVKKITTVDDINNRMFSKRRKSLKSQKSKKVKRRKSRKSKKVKRRKSRKSKKLKFRARSNY